MSKEKNNDNKDNKNNKNETETCDITGKKRKDAQVESNTAAAWAEIDKQKSKGKVPVPSIDNVEEAKDWVDDVKK